jgi:lipoprotein NlpI
MKTCIRLIKGLLIPWLTTAAIVLTACSHWAAPERTSGNRNRAFHLAKSEMDHFVGSIHYQQADAGDHYRLGRYFQQRGRHTLAIAEFSRTIQLDPGRADAHNAMGVSYDQLRLFNLAGQCYRHAQILKPDFAAAYNNLGYSYLMRGQPEKAVAPLETAISLQDRSTRFRNNLALAYRQIGQVEKAHAAFTRSGLQPQPQPLDPSSSLLVSAGRTEKFQGFRNPGDEGPLTLHLAPSEAARTALPTDRTRPADSDATVPGDYDNHSARAMPGDTRSAPLWVAPQIEISNGNGVYKMARNMGSYFKLKGFNIHRLSNADHFDYQRTRIFYSDGQRQVACTLSRMLFGPDIACDLIYNGRNYGKIKVLMGNDVAGLNDLFSGKLKIQVANGNGVHNLARKFSDFLRTKGFYVVHPVNAEHFGYEFTQIVYPAGQLTNAQFLVRAFPRNAARRLVEDDRRKDTIHIIIGEDFTL